MNKKGDYMLSGSCCCLSKALILSLCFHSLYEMMFVYILVSVPERTLVTLFLCLCVSAWVPLIINIKTHI